MSPADIATPEFASRYKQEMRRLFKARRLGHQYLVDAGATKDVLGAAANADFPVMLKLITQFDLAE